MPDREATAGTRTEPIIRPAPHRWLWYAFGGGLPARHRGWVLHDTTTDTWARRHAARALAQLAVPMALILLLAPAPWWIRSVSVVIGLVVGLTFANAVKSRTTESRVVQAGYPAGTGTARRDYVALVHQQRKAARRRAAQRPQERAGTV
jgi:Family of unknown function (DUF5313)